MRTWKIISLIFVILGALNWLLVGAFAFNLVAWMTFNVAWLARILYVLIGLAGIFMITNAIVEHRRREDHYRTTAASVK